uniref:DUF7041 domain-containing protein n=1 Tax=Glossina austeni TaxID=7395 RepID=A0A1A9UYC9_GLOAU
MSCRCFEAWFIRADRQFASKGVTQNSTKYEFMQTALPYEVIMSVFDHVQNAPTNNMYEELKKPLIERHALGEAFKLDKILADSCMGDRKTSEFCRHLCIAVGSIISTGVLKKLWIRKLPRILSIVLTGSNIKDIKELVTLADDVWEVSC